MEASASREHAARVQTRAHTLRIDAATAEVMAAFAAASVDARVVKGPVIASWLYRDGNPRLYLDSDLLVNPDHVERAGQVLSELGFDRPLDERALPEWWREHDIAWGRAADGVWVDLHVSLPGIGVDAATAWGLLTEATDTIAVAGLAAPTLGIAAHALHLALHATHHGQRPGRSQLDLERGLAQCDEPVWQRAALLAERLDATDSFAVGLRSTPAGSALAARLGLPETRSVEVALVASAPPPGALTVEKLAAAKGIRLRVAIVSRKLVPPAAYMRVWAPDATRGRLALARAYARRPFWVARMAPRALRAYVDARRKVRHHGDPGGP